MAQEPTAVEQAIVRALRDNLERIQRTADELHHAVSDVVSACASNKPTNRHYCARKLPQPLLPLRWKYSQDSWLPRCRRALARPSKGNSPTWSAGLLPSRLLRRSGRRLRSQFRRQHRLRPRVLYLLRGPRP
ncbi:MAG: hypothetical protein DMG45_17620 [Acidobacteria bacterium]|nr:MAG: hypothetical protein DMG45_17620 [Acidobacteriota bacterium]